MIKTPLPADAGIKNILVTRTDRLGDVILTLPVIHQLKKTLPDAKIYFLVKRYVKDLLKDYEDIDELVIEEEYDKPSAKVQFMKEKDIDLAINVKPKFEIAFTSYAAGVRYRIGTAYRWFSFFYNLKVREHRKYSDKHEYEYNLNLLRPLSDNIDYGKTFKFRYPDKEAEELNAKLKLSGEKFIIIHPGSGGSSKDLPAGTLRKFAEGFINEFPGYKIFFTGTGRENELIDEITRNLNSGNFLNLCSKLNLRELAVLIGKSALFVSNSTGPVHIAGALNKNIIAFYPNKRPNNEIRWKPLSKNAVILKPADGSDDMDLITADEILNETKRILC